MRGPDRRLHHGFSLLDALVALMVLAVALGVGLVYGIFRDSPARRGGYWLTCSIAFNQFHKGLTLWANDFGGAYPIPTNISPETAAISAHPGNSSANFFSYMIYETYYSPEVVTCPDDVSPNVVVMGDYRYGAQDDPNWNPAWKWDPDLVVDLTARDANVSYATSALIGDRAKNQWRNSLDPNFAVAGDRGPRDGAWDARSRTLLHGGNVNDWSGNIAFNDGSVRRMTWRQSDSQPFFVNGDNLFRSDDAEKGADMWLGVFGATDERTTTPYWD